jgi:hypothetical protein
MVQGPRPWFKGVALQGVSARPFKRSRSNLRRNTIIVSEFPIFAPVLVQVTMVHEPVFNFLQLSPHLSSLLGKAPGLSALLLGVLAMRGFSGCKARKAGLGPWAGGSPSMELTAAHREPSGALAWRASARSGLAPLARPIGAKSPWNTFFEVGVCHAKISTSYGVLLYPILGGVARCGWLGPWAGHTHLAPHF